jgi:hypothetical protein
VKTTVGSELSLVSGSGTYHENKVSVVMEMASFSLKIRHVFGFTSLTERSIGAGPPVIIQLSGLSPRPHMKALGTRLGSILANLRACSYGQKLSRLARKLFDKFTSEISPCYENNMKSYIAFI